MKTLIFSDSIITKKKIKEAKILRWEWKSWNKEIPPISDYDILIIDMKVDGKIGQVNLNTLKNIFEEAVKESKIIIIVNWKTVNVVKIPSFVSVEDEEAWEEWHHEEELGYHNNYFVLDNLKVKIEEIGSLLDEDGKLVKRDPIFREYFKGGTEVHKVIGGIEQRGIQLKGNERIYPCDVIGECKHSNNISACAIQYGKSTIIFLPSQRNRNSVSKITELCAVGLYYTKHIIKRFSGRDLHKFPQSMKKSVKVKKRSRTLAKFPTPPNTSWNMVNIQFISKDSVKISVKSFHKRYTFAELGFKDNRKGDLPDKQWEVLKCLAEEKGELSWQKGTAKPIIQKRIQEIRKRLKAIMGIEDDPFFPYSQNKSYKTRFIIEDKSYS